MSRKASRRKQPVAVSGASPAQWSGFLLLVVAVMASATGVVWTTHKSRLLLNEFQQLEKRRNNLQVEWRQLLLEQSSLVSQGRIEDKAIAELDMIVPEMEKVVIVKGD